MGFFDNISGLLSSNDEEKNKINSLYGVPQGVVDEANGGTMMGLGGLLMAAGQRQTPAQRAQWLSQIGNVSNSRDSNIYKAAQARLMEQQIKNQQNKVHYFKGPDDRTYAVDANDPSKGAIPVAGQAGGGYRTATGAPISSIKPGEVYFGPDGKPGVVSGSGTNLNIENKQESAEAQELGKNYATKRLALEDSANVAPMAISRLTLMQNVLSKSAQGPLSGVLGTAGGLAQQLGISDEMLKKAGIDPNQATTNDIANKINSQLVKDSLASKEFPSNNFSDADRNFITKSFPNIQNMPGANQAITDIMIAKHNYDLLRGSEWEKYQTEAEQNGKRPEFDKFERKWRADHSKDNIFAPIQEKLNSGAYGYPKSASDNVPKISTQEDYDKLPVGAEYIAPNGKKLTKGGM